MGNMREKSDFLLQGKENSFIQEGELFTVVVRLLDLLGVHGGQGNYKLSVLIRGRNNTEFKSFSVFQYF